MDSFEWNKVAGGVLGTTLFIMAVGVITESVFHVAPLAKQSYVVEGVEHEATIAAPAAPAAEPLPDWAAVIPTANAQNGAMVFERCGVCHTVTKGGANGIGPNLYGVVGRARASHPGFDYSPAMKAKGGEWTYDDIFAFVKSPQIALPGNKMAFAGLPRVSDRTDLIAYLRNQADSPAPLPPPRPAAEPAAAEGTPAEAAGPPVGDGTAPTSPQEAGAPATPAAGEAPQTAH